MNDDIKVKSKDGSITLYYNEMNPLYQFNYDGSLHLNVTKQALLDIRRRIPETKKGLDVVVVTGDVYQGFTGVTRFHRFTGRGLLALEENVSDNGEPTLWDWLKNRKNYTYFINLRPHF